MTFRRVELEGDCDCRISSRKVTEGAPALVGDADAEIIQTVAIFFNTVTPSLKKKHGRSVTIVCVCLFCCFVVDSYVSLLPSAARQHTILALNWIQASRCSLT